MTILVLNLILLIFINQIQTIDIFWDVKINLTAHMIRNFIKKIE
jgi:hypothetical protein